MVAWEKKYMTMIVGKMIDNMAWRHCILIDSVKSRDNYFDYNNEIGACAD